jgi:hypothetical protein
MTWAQKELVCIRLLVSVVSLTQFERDLAPSRLSVDILDQLLISRLEIDPQTMT